MGYLDKVKGLMRDADLEDKTGIDCEISEISEKRVTTRRPKLVPGPPEWHAETIAAAVQEEGICIFWSELFQEMIAFIADASFRKQVPRGMVAYTDAELRQMFGGKARLSEDTLKLIHQAKKKLGARVTEVEPKNDSLPPS